MPVEERFCDERYKGICRAIDLHVAHIEDRFEALEKALNTKAHVAEEKIKNKIAVWGIWVTIVLIMLEISLHIWGKR